MGNRLYTWEREENHDYDDIINLPHKASDKREHMSMINRAAQFSPFSALNGFDESIDDASCFTQLQEIFFEDRVSEINDILITLHPGDKVIIKYFVLDRDINPNSRKNGGEYRCVEGIVKKLDDIDKKLTLLLPAEDINTGIKKLPTITISFDKIVEVKCE